jgi:2-hydroxy-6-oxonona-2,4-dienedioate hydrolase
MKSAMFVSEVGRVKMLEWHHTFRSESTVAVESRTVETPYGTTHVLVCGADDSPPLVCLHGALATSAHLLPEVVTLSAHRRLYLVDVVGQSVMSADRRLAVDDDTYGRWLVAVLDALDLDRVALFGVSWGGFVAMRTACFAPERTSALALMVPAGVVDGPAWKGFAQVGFPMLTYRLFGSESGKQKFLRSIFTKIDERWTSYFVEALAAYRLDVRVPKLVTKETAAAYRGPVLAFGAADDLSFPGGALVARIVELFPEAATNLIPDCRHCPPFDDDFRASTARTVMAFLREHEEPVVAKGAPEREKCVIVDPA